MSVDLITFQDFDKVCRLCLSFEELQPIFHAKYLKLISSFTNLEIQNEDNFPKNICKLCTIQLETIISFIDSYKATTETLKNIISQKNSATYDSFDEKVSDEDEISFSSKNTTSVILKEETDTVCFNSDTNSNDGGVSCPNCSENFSSTKILHEHYKEIVICRPKGYQAHSKFVRRSFENFWEFVDEEKKPEISDIDQEYVEHKLKGKRKFLCNYCGKNYTRKSGLDRHIMSHVGEKPFECKECGKRYITKDTLKTHILIHTGIKTHKCEVCQKSFIQSSHLNYHMRRHAGDKPHICSFCNKGFLSSYHLERHKLMHTGVKPYKCEVCNKQFVRSTTLRDHLLLHSGEKPFQCQHCGKQFNRKQTLTNHVNFVHMGQ